MGLDTAHLARKSVGIRERIDLKPTTAALGDAGALMAAAWFTLCGCRVAWPLEPARYDLVAEFDGSLQRVQVKTTTHWSRGSWVSGIRTSGGRKPAYDPDDVDYFFIVDGDLNYFLIPIAVVAGMWNLSLSAYQAFKVGSAGDALVPSLRVAEETT